MRIVAVLGLLVALAGCTDAPPVAQPLESVTVEETTQPVASGNETGDLLMQVVTPELEPVDGARVVAAGKEAFTDREGKTRLLGLPLGLLEVTVEKDGFRAATLNVNLTEPTQEVRAKLLPQAKTGQAPEPRNHSYQETFQFQGFFDCSLTYLIITGDCAVILDFVANETGVPAEPGSYTNEENVFEFPLDADWKSIILEMHWEASTAGAERMSINLEPAEDDESGHARRYARAEGESPLGLRMDVGVGHENASHPDEEGALQDMPSEAGGEVLQARVFTLGEFHRPGGTDFLGVGAAVSQSFEVTIVTFYGEPAPDGYSID